MGKGSILSFKKTKKNYSKFEDLFENLNIKTQKVATNQQSRPQQFGQNGKSFPQISSSVRVQKLQAMHFLRRMESCPLKMLILV